MNASDDDNSSAGDEQWAGQWVTSLQSTDVLFGRGSGPNDHEGNILFRSLVSDRKSEYIATNHRQTKTKIAREIIDTVLAQNGRFMKKIDPAKAKKWGIPKGVDAWCPVDERTIMEKAKQALRQKSEKGGDDLPDPTSPEASPASASPIPPETLSHYAHETSDEAHWNTGHPDHIPMYASNQGHHLHALPRGAYHSEDDPPSKQMMAAHDMADLDREHLAEMNVHRNAVRYDGDEEVGDGLDDEERRQSLCVEDLMHSIQHVGTDEFGSSHTNSSNINYNHESNESMGTIEPLAMDASSVSMMSMSSILKGPLCDTPRSSFTGHPGLTRLESARSPGSRGKRYERDASGRSFKTEYSGMSDMSMSLSHLDASLGDGGLRNGHHVSLVFEGEEGEEGASKVALSFEPRPVKLMEEHPDSLDAMGDSSKNLIQSVLGTSGESSLFSGASKASLSFEPRPIKLMVEQPDSLDGMGDSSKNLIQSALGKSGESSSFSGTESLDMHGETSGSLH